MTQPRIPILKADCLTAVKHGFFSRQGGVSTHLYDSLNCSFRDNRNQKYRDKRAHVVENRKRAVEAAGLSVQNLCTLSQVHGNKVVVLKSVPSKVPVADGVVTTAPQLVLGIQTADCVPVLFLDGKHKVIGAAHAGWRGALAGVIQETVEAMEKCGAKASSISAAIGPCIDQESYEVSEELYREFLNQSSENKQFFEPQDTPGKFLFDLPGYVEYQLSHCNVGQVERLPYSTYEQEDLFFSCRRATHQGEKDFGGHLSIISLESAEE
jgi:polyphenol oxidase